MHFQTEYDTDTETSFYVYARPPTGINVVACFDALNLQIKLCVIFAVLELLLLQQRNWSQFFLYDTGLEQQQQLQDLFNGLFSWRAW